MNDQISYRWVQPSNSVLACVHSLVSLVYLVPPIVLPSIPIHTRMMYTLIIIHYWKQICDQSVLIWLDQSTEDREWASPFCVESTAQGQTVERYKKMGTLTFWFCFHLHPTKLKKKNIKAFFFKNQIDHCAGKYLKEAELKLFFIQIENDKRKLW